MTSNQGEVVGVPESAGEEGALTGRKTIDLRMTLVASHQAVAHEVAFDGRDFFADAGHLDACLSALGEAKPGVPVFLKVSPLGGIEAIYGRYRPEERQALTALAHRHGLAVTGGSDHHGTFKPDLQVGIGRGDLDVPDSILDDLRARIPVG